jgi:CHAT domain-containing protein
VSGGQVLEPHRLRNSIFERHTIHLTSAFQLSGSRHVIGTLWEINDAIAVQIAASFYRGLGSGPGDLDPDQAAHALHRAIRALRDDYAQSPFLWASYMHAGA